MAVTGYSRLQVRLHWIMVGLVAVQFVFHEGMARVWDAGLASGALELSTPVYLHFGFGSLILGLAMWRLGVRREQGVPDPPEHEPPVFQLASKIAHNGFYILLIALPITGGLAWGRASAEMGFVHEVLRVALLLLIIAHVGAVLVHQFVWKTNLLARMTKAEDR